MTYLTVETHMYTILLLKN